MTNATKKIDKVQAIVQRHTARMAAELRQQLGAEMEQALRHLVAGGKLVYQGTSARALGLPPKRKARPMSAEQLRCKHGEGGKACRNKSRGPRYHYRCEEHTLPAAEAKKTKRAMKAARARRRAAR